MHADINTKDFRDKINEGGYELLDTRTPEEFNDGHLKDSVNIDFRNASFKDEIEKLDKDKKYLVYCRSGNRSGQAMEMMKQMGFDEVYNLEGGILKWEEDRYEIVK